MNAPESNYVAFISYSREDAELVGTLFDLLRSVGSTFLDKVSLAPGDHWQQKVDNVISSCSVFLLFWCHHAAASQAVEHEYRVGLAAGRRIVPVLIDVGPRLPDPLQPFQRVDLAQFVSHRIGVHRPHHEAGPALRETYLGDAEAVRTVDKALLEACGLEC